jgi:hypothetical protein
MSQKSSFTQPSRFVSQALTPNTIRDINSSGINNYSLGIYMITSEQVRAARGLVRWDQKDPSDASGISLPAIKRLEQTPGLLAAQARTVEAIIAAFWNAGVEFIDENGGGPGVQLRKAKRRASPGLDKGGRR